MTTEQEGPGQFVMPRNLKNLDILGRKAEEPLDPEIVKLFENNQEVQDLWRDGLMFGFMDKSEVERLLRDQSEGTFLIRFSGTHVGGIAISFLVEGGQIRHFCFTQTDLSLLSIRQRVQNVQFLTNIFCPRPLNGQFARKKTDVFPIIELSGDEYKI